MTAVSLCAIAGSCVGEARAGAALYLRTGTRVMIRSSAGLLNFSDKATNVCLHQEP
jgi:hypothetical protein